MYCKKCGFNIEKNWKYCPKCKANLQNGNIEINKEVMIEQQKKEKKNSLICLCIFFIGIIGLFTIDNYKGLFFLVSLISIVTGYIKCQNNKLIKILFWLFLISVIMYFLLIIVIIFTCANTISKWDCSGIG